MRMARAIEHAHDELIRGDTLRVSNCTHIFARGLFESDDPRRIAWAYGELLHVHVGRVEQTPMLSGCQDGEGVRPRFGGDGRALERIKCDIDPRAGANRATDF